MNRIVLQEIRRVYRFSIHRPHWERDRENRDHFIAYKLYGYTMHESGGRQYPVLKDTVMVANAEDMYRATENEMDRTAAKGDCIAVHFTTAEPFGMHLAVYDCSSQPQMKSDFFRMLDAWNQFETGRNPAAEYACIAGFYSVIARLIAMNSTGEGSESGRIAEAKAYIDRNFADSTLSVADAAACASLGTRRFGELFRAQYSMTPGRYLTQRRLGAAIERLKENRIGIAEIAAVTGYSSASYFIRVFRQEIGVSPSTYRAQLLEK